MRTASTAFGARHVNAKVITKPKRRGRLTDACIRLILGINFFSTTILILYIFPCCCSTIYTYIIYSLMK